MANSPFDLVSGGVTTFLSSSHFVDFVVEPRMIEASAIAMNENPTAPRNRFPWPPVIYVLAAAAAIIAQVCYPLGWLPGAVGGMAAIAGAMVIALGLYLDVATLLALRRQGTTVMPHRAAKRLVTTGPFRISRNPIYLGNTLVVIGIGLLIGSVWFLLTAFVAAFAVSKLAIEREEKHLARQFGSAWHAYARKTRRWF